jgi:hypothetical protein
MIGMFVRRNKLTIKLNKYEKNITNNSFNAQ